MRLLVLPLLKTSIPLALAITVGAMFASMGPTFAAVGDEKCERFYGTSHGNDPSQSVAMLLCRSGDEVYALRHSEGDAGVTTFALEGKVTEDDRIRMTVHMTTANAPAAGWVTCTDDVFDLRWDAAENTLYGHYRSEQCSDTAVLRLVRAD